MMMNLRCSVWHGIGWCVLGTSVVGKWRWWMVPLLNHDIQLYFCGEKTINYSVPKTESITQHRSSS